MQISTNRWDYISVQVQNIKIFRIYFCSLGCPLRCSIRLRFGDEKLTTFTNSNCSGSHPFGWINNSKEDDVHLNGSADFNILFSKETAKAPLLRNRGSKCPHCRSQEFSFPPLINHMCGLIYLPVRQTSLYTYVQCKC